ncbi:MAG: glycosyltransferase family 2 protein [Longimicrobiales bacterium]|nr:glycosyltransferase family 2 protein [Longimicrobiales bacterium]
MILLSLLLGSLVTVLLLPTLSDLISLVTPARTVDRARDGEVPRLLFLVPAHDEELLLGRCLWSVLAVDHPLERTRVLVVADNCTDSTAAVARACGVECLERTDTRNPGKPRALAWALKQISLDQIDGIVILDADSLVDVGYARALPAADRLRTRVIQGYNDVSNPSESVLTRMAAVFSAVRSLGMNRVKQRRGLTSPLGNGYCLGADVVRRMGWPAYSICEDWELYAILTAVGVRIENRPGARVRSQEARSLDQSASQRKRWTAGKIAVLLDRGPEIVISRAIGLHQKVDALGELLSPGPAVHLGVAVLIAGITLWAAPPAALILAGAALFSLVRLSAYTIVALPHVPEPRRALRAFLVLPAYVVWRLVIQAASLPLTGSRQWIRTTRHQEVEGGPSPATPPLQEGRTV